MNVLVLIDSLTLGGAENVLATLARAAPAVGIRLQVTSLEAPRGERATLLAALERAGLRPRFLGIPRLAHPAAVPRVAAAVRDSGCDVVHAHLEYAAVLAPIAARMCGRRAVATLHHVPGRLPRREALKERLAVSAATRGGGLICVSRASLDAFADRYRSRPGAWTVVHNGVDLSLFDPAPAPPPADLSLPAGAPLVAFVAAMRGRKGHACALHAWRRLADSRPDARLLLVGSGAEEPALRALARRLGLDGSVRFTGYRDDVARLMRASTLVLLPSQIEALPTTLIEAAACGRAVVASDVGGVPEVVTHGRSGLLVPPDDPDRLAGAVRALLDDGPRREAMGRAAREIAERRFDMHLWARRLRRVYERVAAGVSPDAADQVTTR